MSLIVAAIAAIVHAKIAPILAYFTTVWTGEASPAWPHAILLFVSIGGAIVCTVGIVFEAEKRKSHPLHKIAEKLVIWGVVIEALCTICLFVFDERISNAQELKIVSLETRLEQQDEDLATAIRALTPRHLDQKAATAVVANLSKVPVGIVPAEDPESKNLADDIGYVFRAWEPQRIESSKFLPSGITIAYVGEFPWFPGVPNDAKDAAFAFCKELSKQNIEASITGSRHWNADWPKGLATNGIAIFVGVKPNRFLEKIYAVEGVKRPPPGYGLGKGAPCK